MNRFTKRLLNILLYPVRFFMGLNDNKTTLYIGIIIVGIIDVFSPDFIGTYKSFFTGKPTGDVNFNILLAIVMVIVLGVVDTAIFSIPLFDFFKYLKKREGSPHKASLIKAMKIYIMTNILVIFVITILYYAIFNNISGTSSTAMQYVDLAFFFIVQLIWPSAIITRGFNTIFNFNPIFRRLTFIIVFTWSFIFGMVFNIQVLNRVLLLFK